VEANTIYGKIGVKVWLCKGEILDKVDLFPAPVKRDRKGNYGKGNNDRKRNDRRRRK
jgi:small subunit ribosomal protein S3